MKIVKHLLKCYFKHIFIILVASKRQTYRFKSLLRVFLFRNRSFSRDVTANYAEAGRPEVSHAGGQPSGRLISK